MSLPNSGPISASAIRTEFGGPALFSLQQYYRGGPYVPNSSANASIPTSGTIKYSDFRGATSCTNYTLNATITIISETASQYQNNNNGQVTVTVSGNSPSYTVTWPGPNGTTRTMYSGQSYTVGGYDQTNQPSITITDIGGARTYGPFLIDYNVANRTFSYSSTVCVTGANNATVTIYSETASQYQNNNNGRISVAINGASPSYTVTWSGSNGTTRVMYSGQSYEVGGYDQSDQPTITITNNGVSRIYGPFLIDYNIADRTQYFTF
jgi:hypothetical protein